MYKGTLYIVLLGLFFLPKTAFSQSNKSGKVKTKTNISIQVKQDLSDFSNLFERDWKDIKFHDEFPNVMKNTGKCIQYGFYVSHCYKLHITDGDAARAP